MYKIIAIDLDGTLLNSQGEISEENKNYLKKAIDTEPFKLVNWLEFTDISLNKNKNINSIIISMASYLGEFNYYYYWVLANLEDANSNLEKALEYYQKSSNLNPLFEPAKKRVEELKL